MKCILNSVYYSFHFISIVRDGPRKTGLCEINRCNLLLQFLSTNYNDFSSTEFFNNKAYFITNSCDVIRRSLLLKCIVTNSYFIEVDFSWPAL